MLTIKIVSILVILLITLVSGIYPFFRKISTQKAHEFPIGESLAAGVFLGAGLMHMLGDASEQFYALHVNYPMAFLLAGASFLFLLLLEHIGREVYHHGGDQSRKFAVLAVLMLSIHSFLAGAALGLTTTLSVTLIILLAICAHKWAASFALAIYINKSSLSLKTGLGLFVLFACMAPLGIMLGSESLTSLHQYPLIEPVFASLASGTFLYLGTLHGLERATLIKQCCNLNRFMFVIVGFAIMAIVAIWT